MVRGEIKRSTIPIYSILYGPVWIYFSLCVWIQTVDVCLAIPRPLRGTCSVFWLVGDCLQTCRTLRTSELSWSMGWLKGKLPGLAPKFWLEKSIVSCRCSWKTNPLSWVPDPNRVVFWSMLTEWLDRLTDCAYLESAHFRQLALDDSSSWQDAARGGTRCSSDMCTVAILICWVERWEDCAQSSTSEPRIVFSPFIAGRTSRGQCGVCYV